jgi:site-specific recombinase XerD
LAQGLVKTAAGVADLPALFAPTPDAARRYVEFFTANIRNPNTRRAYARAAADFAAWCETNGLTELRDIEPVHVAAYVEGLQLKLSAPSVKLHLAGIRMLFDWLVIGQLLAVNPASSVRGPKHSVRKGKTPVLAADEARTLLDAIDATTLTGLRDRALIARLQHLRRPEPFS